METNLQKLAADAIRQLQSEKESLQKDLDLFKKASSIAFDLFSKGIISAEDIESNFNALLEKDSDELAVMEKAASFSGQNNGALFGKLSDKPADDGSMDPLTRMLIEDL